MKFEQLFEEIIEIKVTAASKKRYFNYVDSTFKKIKKGLGQPIILNVKLPVEMKLFIIKNNVYDEYTGRKVVANINSIKNLEDKFNDPEFIKYTNNKQEWIKYYNNLKTLNLKELNIRGNVQDLTVETEISPAKKRLMDFKKDVFEELKIELEKNSIGIDEKTKKFNISNKYVSKKESGHVLKSNKFKHEYFLVLRYDQHRSKVDIEMYEKSTGMRARNYYGIYDFINDLNNIFTQDRKIDISSYTKIN